MNIIGYLFFIIINLMGSLTAIWYSQQKKGWKWSRYFVMIFWPIFGTVVLSYYEGWRILLLFFISMFIGFILEIRLNQDFEKTLGEKFYFYRKLTYRGYSSMLTLPFWGAAGVIFFIIAKFLGL